MARKASVILSAQERKDVQSGIKAEIVTAKSEINALKAKRKELDKELKIQEKTLTGLQTRLDALKPAKPAFKVGAIA